MLHTIKITEGFLTRLLNFTVHAIEDMYRYYQYVMLYFAGFGFRRVHPSFVNNLKNAILHFRKLYEHHERVLGVEDCDDEAGEDLIAEIVQAELLFDHLNRGITDLHVELLFNINLFLESEIALIRTHPHYFNLEIHRTYCQTITEKLYIFKRFLMEFRASKLGIASLAVHHPGTVGYDTLTLSRLMEVQEQVSQTLEIIFAHFSDAKLKSLYESIAEDLDSQYPKDLRVAL